jgi:hypothetical protein
MTLLSPFARQCSQIFEIQQEDCPVEVKSAQQRVLDSKISLIYRLPDPNI